MADPPPQLGEISQSSGFNVPTLQANMNDNTSGAGSVRGAKDSIYDSTHVAVNTVQNHPVTQNMKDTVSNVSSFILSFLLVPYPCSSPTGPVADKVRDEHAKTSSEFRNLAGSRTTPNNSTATAQPLTHYHSFFYNLLSWENPRATTLAYLGIVSFIFAARYLPALRWAFKALYFTLGVTAAAEVAGKLVLSQGLASSFRPKKYFTIPREALESSLEDVEQLMNFFVIEFQRVLFAENVTHTITGFVAALLSYWLIKFVPFWGLSLITISCVFLGPLIYMSNQEFIDEHLRNASDVVNSQANQVKDLAGHHTARAQSTVKAYAGDYSAKAQEYIGSARGRSNSPEVSNSSAKSTANAPVKSEPGSKGPDYSPSDFPHAPKQEPTAGVTSHQEQYENSTFGGQAAEPAS